MLTYVVDGWRRMSTPRKIRRVFMLTLLGIGVWALTPYFFSRTVDEAFPSGPSPAAEPRALARGSFTRVDPVHAAEGTATLFRQADGALLLRFDGFSSTNGPDLVVGLSGHPAPRNPIEVRQQGWEQLEPLKANRGDQNYTLPPGLDPGAFKSVVIYCRTFNVVFSTAELGPAG